MISPLLQKNIKTKFFTFTHFEHSHTKWDESFSFETIVFHFSSPLVDQASIHFTTFTYEEIEVTPFVSEINEDIRCELSFLVQQLTHLFHRQPFYKEHPLCPTFFFRLSDIFIQDMDSYDERQQLTFLLQHKHVITEIENTLSTPSSQPTYHLDTPPLVLVGKDGRILAEFLERLAVCRILFKQDEFLSVIQFTSNQPDSPLLIDTIKQKLESLGYLCHHLHHPFSKRWIDQDFFYC